MKRDFDRRRVLAALGASAAGMLIAPRYVAAAGDAGCVVRPQQTEGPYFVDEKLNRSDIRIDPADGSSRPGVPLRVTFHVSKLTGSACAPPSFRKPPLCSLVISPRARVLITKSG